MKVVKVLATVGLGLYLLSGLYFVQPEEQAVVRRFGAVITPLGEPGPHFGLPWGLDRVVRVKPGEMKRVTIGLPQVSGGALGTGTAQFLTGDRNLVNVQATVQYTILEPTRYLFNAVSVDKLVARAAEGILAGVIAVEPVDFVLTEGKRELSDRIARGLQERVDRYELGIFIRSVDIAAVEPPPEVADAFDAVISALRQKEQKINEARGYESQILEEAKGERNRELDQAKAYRDGLVNQAAGDASRFESLLAKYRRAPELTATRMYLETMKEILPRFRSKLIVDPDSGLDLSIIPEDEPVENAAGPSGSR